MNTAMLSARRRAERVRRAEYGWLLGESLQPRGVQLWVPHDRTTGVFGAQGSGKTLDLLAPALLAHPGPALLTLTKPEDLYLLLLARTQPVKPGGPPRPVLVLDPYGIAPGVPELVVDVVDGCTNSETAERRAAGFAAGTVQQAAGASGDEAARFYAGEATKVLQGYFHAAALTGRNLDHVLQWVASPRTSPLPEQILAAHPAAAEHWAGLLHSALHGDPRTTGNTITTVQQAMKLFFQPAYRARCVPGPGRPATNVADVIAQGGTIFLLGREDRLISASPLMTAVTEHILDTAKDLAMASDHGRLGPSFLAELDEIPSTAPIPTLAQRMANERALGITFIYASQTWRQLVVQYGEDTAWVLFGLTNVAVAFGRGKDMRLYEELSSLIGPRWAERRSHSTNGWSGGGSRTSSWEKEPVIEPAAIRRIPERQALVIADDAAPIIAKLHRCLDGKAGNALLEQQEQVRGQVSDARTARQQATITDAEARAWAQAHGFGIEPPATGAGSDSTASSTAEEQDLGTAPTPALNPAPASTGTTPSLWSMP